MKTDEQLQQSVLEELRADPSIAAPAIGVEARDGIITLAGHVESYAQKLAAEAAAQRVAGVRGVVMEIDVALPHSSRRADAELAQAARHALDWNISVPKDAVKISVNGGWIKLSGEVDWAYQRAAAVGSVRDLLGITGIDDGIRLRQRPIDPDNLKKRIREALHRQAQQDARAIGVEVSGSTVTLSGVVDSHSERVTARNAAWSALGVRQVVDNICVAGADASYLGV